MNSYGFTSHSSIRSTISDPDVADATDWWLYFTFFAKQQGIATITITGDGADPAEILIEINENREITKFEDVSSGE